MKTTFIYALCEPGTRTVRYIGKTNDPARRLKNHLCESSKFNSHLGYWLQSLSEPPVFVVLHKVAENESWSDEERRYISCARAIGMRLVNGTDGGEGGSGPATPETRAKLSASKSGAKNPNFGKHLSPEASAKRSAAMTGEKNHNFGKTGEASAHFGTTRSPETRAKISAALSGEKSYLFGKHHTPESNARRSAALSGEKNHNFGKPLPPEVRAKISATKKASAALRKLQDQEIEWALAPYTLE